MNGEQFIARRIAGFEQNERRQNTIGAGYYTKYDNLPSGVTLDQWKAYDGSGVATDLDAIWLNRIGFAPIEIVNYEAGNELNYTKYMRQTGLTQDYTLSVSNASDVVSIIFRLDIQTTKG
jgi:hypothetical protein